MTPGFEHADYGERFWLRAGMRIQLQEGPAKVLRVTPSSAVCQLETKLVKDFKTVWGVPVHIEASGRLVRISPNSEVEVLA